MENIIVRAGLHSVETLSKQDSLCILLLPYLFVLSATMFNVSTYTSGTSGTHKNGGIKARNIQRLSPNKDQMDSMYSRSGPPLFLISSVIIFTKYDTLGILSPMLTSQRKGIIAYEAIKHLSSQF